MAGAVLATQSLLAPGADADPALGAQLLGLALPIGLGIAVHVGVHHALGGEETRMLWVRVRGKLGRR